jgi:uncharacterized protein
VFSTVSPPPRRLLVFARLPELGKVKTRLAQSIGEEKALAVYQAMTSDLLASIGTSTRELEIEIAWAPTVTANAETLQSAFGNRSLAMQTGTTLGDRIAMAFSERFFFHRTETIVAIGVDDPRLTREVIDHAFSLLDSCEWVVGPARDGGYYLIGCRAGAFDTSLFRDVDWGSDSVLSTTLQRIRQREQTLALLPMRYDIDVEDDLRRFASEHAEGALPTLLRAWGWAA